MSQFIEQLQEYRDAAYPILYVQSHEEQRVMDAITEGIPETDVFSWTSTKGLLNINGESVSGADGNPNKITELIRNLPASSIIVLKDFHGPFAAAGIGRAFRDLLGHLESTGKTIIILSPIVVIPTELEKDVTLLPFPLPKKAELTKILDAIITEQEQANNIKIPTTAHAAVVAAASSMTANEARNAFALALGKYGEFGEPAARLVLGEKAQMLKKTNILVWHDVNTPIEKLGGFGNVKKHLETIAPIYWEPEQAEQWGLTPEDWPRSMLLAGLPGTGKSYAINAIAHYLRIGLVESKFGRIFSVGGGRVGAAEGNVEARNQMVEAMEPVLDWWDEADRLVGGMVSGSRENPWEARVGGSVLTWFEQFRAKVFVTATLNRPKMFPVEMLSRFQVVFFVDLPSLSERVDIFKIQCDNRPMIKVDPSDLQELAGMTDKFSGREIRNAVQKSVQLGFAKSLTQVTLSTLYQGVQAIKPVAKTSPEEIEELREWAVKNNVEPASSAKDRTELGGKRQIRVGGRG